MAGKHGRETWSGNMAGKHGREKRSGNMAGKPVRERSRKTGNIRNSRITIVRECKEMDKYCSMDHINKEELIEQFT
ncbi:MAG: hypothetical protein K6G42_11680, partial [Lachnospiraceae bacterium]|nr:hypothetical protein [Lachnospiraceae bacterium]